MIARDTAGWDELERPVALRDQIYDRVRRFLREGPLRPGDRLREQTVADSLGVSRTPVREALMRLAQEELVVPAGRGFEVPRLTATDLADIFGLRRALEPEAFAQVAAAGESAALKAAMTRGDAADAAGNVAAVARANAAFRAAWFAAVPNRRLVAAMQLYDDHLVHLRRLTHADAATRALMNHGRAALVQSVRDRAPDAARAAMVENLRNAEASMQAVLHLQ